MNDTMTKQLAFVLVVLLVGTGLTSNGLAQGNEDAQKQKASQQLQKLAKDRRSLVDEDIESLSGQEKLQRAQTKISTGRESLTETNAMLEDARKKEKDIQKINCINDKQAAIKGFLKVAEQSYVKLKNAVGNGDAEEANHHYTLISISDQKVGKLTEEARLCAGDVQRYAEGTQVQVDIDDNIADDPDYLTSDPSRLLVLPELTPFQ